MDSFDPALMSSCPAIAPLPLSKRRLSVLGRTYPRVELVVGDDGSIDGANGILLHLAAAHPERITPLFQNRNAPVAARNRALAHANGNYIAFLDADDTWRSNALSRMHAALETRPADIAYCGCQAIGSAATDTQPNIQLEFAAGEAILHLLRQSPWPTNSTPIRRPLIDELRGLSGRAPTASAMEDDLWLRMPHTA